MSNYLVLCNKCLNVFDFKYYSKFTRVDKESFLCKECKRDISKQSRERICPGCKNIVIYSTSGNRRKCEGRLCRKCISNQIPQLFTKEQESFFNGLMLGDGSLVYGNKKGSLFPRLSVQRQKKDKDYLFWQYEEFKEFYGTEPKYFKSYHNKAEKFYDGYACITKSGQVFKDQYNRWYPNGKKIIPKDLVLDPLTLLIWFLDDGCIIRNGKSLSFKLSTDGFLDDDVCFLEKVLSEFISSEDIHYYKNGKGLILKGSTNPTIKLINVIEPIFPEFMFRKRTWKNFDFEYFNNNRDCYGKRTNISKEARNKLSLILRKNPPLAKLNLDMARDIRRRFFEKKNSRKELAKIFNVSTATISYIINKKIWKEFI